MLEPSYENDGILDQTSPFIVSHFIFPNLSLRLDYTFPIQLSDVDGTISTTGSRSWAHCCLGRTTSKASSPCLPVWEMSLFFRYFELVRDVRQNKGSILKASVDYIRKLKVDQDRKTFLEEKCRVQEYQTRKLIAKLQVFSTVVGCGHWLSIFSEEARII